MIGIILGIIFEHYLLPICDLMLEVYNYKKSNEVTEYSILLEKQKLDYLREYPEARQVEDLQPLIGFHSEDCENYKNEDEEEDYDNEIEDRFNYKIKNKIGY